MSLQGLLTEIDVPYKTLPAFEKSSNKSTFFHQYTAMEESVHLNKNRRDRLRFIFVCEYKNYKDDAVLRPPSKIREEIGHELYMCK